MSEFLSREAMLGKISELKTTTVEAFGGKFLIRELTAGKASELYEGFKAGSNEANVSWVIASVVDPQTLAPIFSDSDRPALNELSFTELNKISKAAIALNGLTATEDTVKNSEPSRNGASATV